MFYDTVIVGGGPTGLSAAYHLQKEGFEDYVLLDANERTGGLARSIYENGFTYDMAGHIVFVTNPNAPTAPYVRELMKVLLGDNVHYQKREAWIHSKDTYTRYPFQANTFGLPDDVVKDCIRGVTEAFLKLPEGYVPTDFEDWIYKVWGEGIAKHFMIPYNKKLWKVPLNEMAHDWLGGRVPVPQLEQIIEGGISEANPPMGPNALFGYPLRGGFQRYMDGFLPFLSRDKIHLRHRVTSVSMKDRAVTCLTEGGKSVDIGFNSLITTMPLPELIRMMDRVPSELRQTADTLRHTSICCVNIGTNREKATDKHWIYYPESDFTFHRIFVQSNASPYNAPEGCSCFIAEISYNSEIPIERNGLEDRVVRDLHKAGLMQKGDEVLSANVVWMPYAYVVYEPGRKAKVDALKNWLYERQIYSFGRFAEWEYYNSDGSMLSGREAAHRCLADHEKKANATYSVPDRVQSVA
ncbi:MAG TPA: FAD-dependent oxidoreductase [Armatimonadota bacterium]|nr:FAD-dependent oxidoreductase [Armatimonadota bacterium]